MTYALTTAGATRINGGAMKMYHDDNPGTVHPGDVLTWLNGVNARADYYGDPNKEPLISSNSNSPYTVQSIEGATFLHLDNGAMI